MGTLKWTIYCHIHIESGRRYVGLTKSTMMRRWNRHVYSANRLGKDFRSTYYFANAIRKYGKDAFYHEVLETCEDLDVANLAEKSWIEFYETTDREKGFNLNDGGGSRPHRNRRNPWKDPIYRAKIVAANMGKLISTETRSKISSATAAFNRIRVVTKETRSKISSSISNLYAARTKIFCKRHGEVSLSECYRRKSKRGIPGARLVCKQCVKGQNRRTNSR
jgi:group I intron endonuclease